MVLPPEHILALLILLSFLFLLLLVLLFYSSRIRRWFSVSFSSLATSPLPSSAPSAPSSVTKAEVEEPLLANDRREVPSEISHSDRIYPSSEDRQEHKVKFSSLLTNLPPNKREKQFIDVRCEDEVKVSSLLANLSPNKIEKQFKDDVTVGQTLRFTDIPNWKEADLVGKDRTATNNTEIIIDSTKSKVLKESTLILEVISGLSCGINCVRKSTNCYAPLTLGRISSSDIFLEDPGVSGKHATINWNKITFKWELMDIGSTNGTLLNSAPVHNPDFRRPGSSAPVELTSGDIITLGSSSKILVQINACHEYAAPFRVGIASDPMTMRRGGKSLAMEDVLYHQWPLPGVNEFGLFCVFDGHGGALAANTAYKILPQIVSHRLSKYEEREKILSLRDASNALREAFSQTEAAMSYQYEGCTATVLLLWVDDMKELFAQCANVGDSACFINIDGVDIKMTEDHRITSPSERNRFRERGQPLESGQTRLYGINIARMLGDKFIKEQDSRFSSEPYVSQVVHLKRTSKAFAILASDGLWDVINIKRAGQVVIQAKEASYGNEENSAENVAKAVLNEAKSLRTKDNTSIIFLDFDTV